MRRAWAVGLAIAVITCCVPLVSSPQFTFQPITIPDAMIIGEPVLYWTDCANDTIFRYVLGGDPLNPSLASVRMVASAGTCSTPGRLSVLGQYVYWGEDSAGQTTWYPIRMSKIMPSEWNPQPSFCACCAAPFSGPPGSYRATPPGESSSAESSPVSSLSLAASYARDIETIHIGDLDYLYWCEHPSRADEGRNGRIVCVAHDHVSEGVIAASGGVMPLDNAWPQRLAVGTLGNQTILLWTDSLNSTICGALVRPDGVPESAAKVLMAFPGDDFPSDIELVGDTLYWCSSSNADGSVNTTIAASYCTVSIQGSGLTLARQVTEVKAPGVHLPGDLSVVNGTLYWLNANDMDIYSCPLAGGTSTLVLDVRQALGPGSYACAMQVVAELQP